MPPMPTPQPPQDDEPDEGEVLPDEENDEVPEPDPEED